MKIKCGPKHDQRFLNFELPYLPKLRNVYTKQLYLRTNNLIQGNSIGCLVSGGADSVLLYFLLIEENLSSGNKFIITPYTIARKGASAPAQNCINYIHDYFQLSRIKLNLIGNPNLPEVEQVESGITDILGRQVDYVYLGIMEDRPEHYQNYLNLKFIETQHRKYPLLNLQKSHIVDLYLKKKLLSLFKLTTSCNKGLWPACGQCNGCEALRWGINEIGILEDLKS